MEDERGHEIRLRHKEVGNKWVYINISQIELFTADILCQCLNNKIYFVSVVIQIHRICFIVCKQPLYHFFVNLEQHSHQNKCKTYCTLLSGASLGENHPQKGLQKILSAPQPASWGTHNVLIPSFHEHVGPGSTAVMTNYRPQAIDAGQTLTGLSSAPNLEPPEATEPSPPVCLHSSSFYV